jgi:hypothetical protein
MKHGTFTCFATMHEIMQEASCVGSSEKQLSGSGLKLHYSSISNDNRTACLDFNFFLCFDGAT